MRGALAATALAAVISASPVAAQSQGANSVTARSLAATCANCHGTNGNAQGAMTPLAGYPADRLVATFADFRSGKRPATIMHQIAKGYSDEQVATIAAFFAAQKK